MIKNIIFLCYVGQKIIDEQEKIGNKIYDIAWYQQKLSVQKKLLLIQIALTRKNCFKAVHFNINMENVYVVSSKKSR